MRLEISAPCDGTVKSLKKEGDSVEFGFDLCQIDTGTTRNQATANPFLTQSSSRECLKPKPHTVSLRIYTPRSTKRGIRFLSTAAATDPSPWSALNEPKDVIHERKIDPTMLFLRELAESTTILESNATNMCLRGTAMEIKYPELIGSKVFGPQVSFPKAVDFGICRLRTSHRPLGLTHEVWANNSNGNILAERQFKYYVGRWKKYESGYDVERDLLPNNACGPNTAKTGKPGETATWVRNLLQAYNTEEAEKQSGIGMYDRYLFYGAAGGAACQQNEFYKFLQLTYDTSYPHTRYHMLTQAIVPDFNLVCKWHLTARSPSGFSTDDTSDLRAAFSDHFINLKPQICAPQTHHSQPIKSPTH